MMARRSKKRPQLNLVVSERHVARASVKKGKTRPNQWYSIEIMQPEMARMKAMEPLAIADAMNRLGKADINVSVEGGGTMGQVDAIRTAVARGLVFWNDGAGETTNSAMNIYALIAAYSLMILGAGAKTSDGPWRSEKETRMLQVIQDAASSSMF